MFGFLRRLKLRPQSRYSGRGYGITIRPGFRELVEIDYVRGWRSMKLDGERYGKRWNNIAVGVPATIAEIDLPQLVTDLSEGLTALGYGYTISRAENPVMVPEEERQKAIESLRAMRMEASVSGNQVKLTKLPNFSTAGLSKEQLVAQGREMMKLATAASGQRTPVTLLAKKDDE